MDMNDISLTRCYVKCTIPIHIQDGIKSHPIVAEEIFGDFTREVFVTMFQDFFYGFRSSQTAQSGSRKMDKMLAHYPMLPSTNIQTHLEFEE